MQADAPPRTHFARAECVPARGLSAIRERMSPFVLRMIVTAVAVLMTAFVVPGFRVKGFFSAFLFAVALAFLDAFLWGFLAPVTWLFTILTLGVAFPIIHVVAFRFAAAAIPGVEVSGCFGAALASIVLAVAQGFLAWLTHVEP
jgi:putative membrane protein